jgi:two-component system sensor histidine kinase BaeS
MARSSAISFVAKSQNPDDELAVAFLIEQQGKPVRSSPLIGVLLSVLAAGLLAAHFPQAGEAAGRRLRAGWGKSQFDTRLNDTTAATNWVNWPTPSIRSRRRLEDTERWRQQWVADTSHELRTPLSVLRAQMEALAGRYPHRHTRHYRVDAEAGAVADETGR